MPPGSSPVVLRYETMKRSYLLIPAVVGIAVAGSLIAACTDDGPQPSTDTLSAVDVPTIVILDRTFNEMSDSGDALACQAYLQDPDASFERMTATGLDLDESTVQRYMSDRCVD